MSALTGIREILLSAEKTFRTELSANERFRRMIWLIVYILMCYGIVGLGDLTSSYEAASESKQSELARLLTSSDASMETWSERKGNESQLQDQLLESCWMSQGPRLASADMQTELQRITKAYSLKNSRLTLSTPETIELDSNEVWLIRAQVRGRLHQPRIPSLLKALEYGENSFAISKLRFVDQRGGGTLNMTLVACFRGDRGE